MELLRVKERAEIDNKSKVSLYINQMNLFLDLVQEKNIIKETISRFNIKIEELNSIKSESELKKKLRKTQGLLLQILTKEHKLVTQNFYRNTWMMVGMGAIGVPIGTAMGLGTKNMGLIGIGLPIGMAIGVVVGLKLDKKAKENGNQLEIEIKY